jgi:hypothetical protein
MAHKYPRLKRFLTLGYRLSYQFMFCHAENTASGHEYFLVYYEIIDGHTTKDGIVVPSTYSVGKTITPPVIPQTS